jgi:hypothetical protein
MRATRCGRPPSSSTALSAWTWATGMAGITGWWPQLVGVFVEGLGKHHLHTYTHTRAPPLPRPLPSFAVHPRNADVAGGSENFFLHLTRDGGSTWTSPFTRYRDCGPRASGQHWSSSGWWPRLSAVDRLRVLLCCCADAPLSWTDDCRA